MSAKTENFIAGQWVTGQGDNLTSYDPANGDAIWSTTTASVGQVGEAFAAARHAFASWALTSFEERKAIVLAYKAQVQARKAEIAELISRETGKPHWETLGEAGALAAKVDVSIQAYGERTGVKHTETDFGYQELAHKPLGVFFVLGPYNFPGHLPNGHIIPALLAGNTLVFKPSEQTPAMGALMVEMWQAAGLPDGVLNLVHGAREVGGAALDNPELDGVLFTGSWKTGQFIHQKFAGRTGIQLALEMGGNNPLVIWDAADHEASARMAILSAYITAGQRCSCARRLILPEGQAGDQVIEAITGLIPQLPIDVWNADPEPFFGPVVSNQAAQAVIAAQDMLKAKGGKVLSEAAIMDKGPAFVSPGLIDTTGCDVPDDEVFGPLLQVRRVASFDAAIAEANNTAYGLSAGLVSDDEALWKQFWVRSRAGIVNWNRPTPGAASTMPFGGPGQSGNLRPSAYYAADYSAYPVATQAATKVEKLPIRGVAS